MKDFIVFLWEEYKPLLFGFVVFLILLLLVVKSAIRHNNLNEVLAGLLAGFLVALVSSLVKRDE